MRSLAAGESSKGDESDAAGNGGVHLLHDPRADTGERDIDLALLEGVPALPEQHHRHPLDVVVGETAVGEDADVQEVEQGSGVVDRGAPACPFMSAMVWMSESARTAIPHRKGIMVATIRRFSYLVPADIPVPATAMLSCIMLPMANSNSPLLTTGTSAWVEAMGMGRSWNPACDETTFEIAVAHLVDRAALRGADGHRLRMGADRSGQRYGRKNAGQLESVHFSPLFLNRQVPCETHTPTAQPAGTCEPDVSVM